MKDTFMNFLKAEIVQVSEKFAKVKGCVKKCFLNVHGTAHGSYLFALADFAFSLVSNYDKPRVAVSMHVNFIKPVYIGEEIVAEAKVIRKTKKFVFCEINVKRENDTILHGTAISYSLTSHTASKCLLSKS